jgi:hypothetical protein
MLRFKLYILPSLADSLLFFHFFIIYLYDENNRKFLHKMCVKESTKIVELSTLSLAVL